MHHLTPYAHTHAGRRAIECLARPLSIFSRRKVRPERVMGSVLKIIPRPANMGSVNIF